MAKKATTKKKELTLAEQFEALEKIVEQFESGDDVSLDDGLKMFEEGLAIAASLKKQLNTVENKVEKLKAKYEE